MNKAQLTAEVRKLLGRGATLAVAERAVAAVFAGLTRGLKRDREVLVVGFGVFEAAVRAARRGYNPHTKKPMKIRALKTVRFRAGRPLRAAL